MPRFNDVGVPVEESANRVSLRMEQFRQARRIHKGIAGLCLATLGVKLSRLPIPSRRLRQRIFRDLYARMYPPGLDEREAEHALGDYSTFNALFTRGVRPECRPISPARTDLVSPCDGTVQDVGRVDGGKILTVKGVEYSAGSMLAGGDISPFEGGHFAIIFLSPIDCHRVFSPLDGRLEEVVHVPGSRLLVHPPFQKPEFPVYTLNERMVLHFTGDEGPCAVVMVAGWGVGNITIPSAPGFRPGSRSIESHRWSPARSVDRGDWVGTFELGSTVVMITPSSSSTTPLVSPGEKVLYGQPVFRRDRPTNSH